MNLITRLDEPRKWTYLVAAIPFVLTALYGWHAGAALPYLIAAAIFAAQFFIPTRLGWGLAFTCYAAASAFYLYLLFVDLYRIASGSSAQVLTDVADTVAFLVWIGLLLLITWLLWMMRRARTVAAS